MTRLKCKRISVKALINYLNFSPGHLLGNFASILTIGDKMSRSVNGLVAVSHHSNNNFLKVSPPALGQMLLDGDFLGINLTHHIPPPLAPRPSTGNRR